MTQEIQGLQKTKMSDAVNAVNTIIANQSSQNEFDRRFGQDRQRQSYFSEFSGDSKHPQAWLDYGYQHNLSFWDYYNMYRRNGFANSVVNLAVDETWQDIPRVTDDPKSTEPTEWEKSFNEFATETGLWSAMKGLDERQRVGRWGGVYLEIRDGKDASERPERLSSEYAVPEQLYKIKPLYESQLEPLDFETDPKSVAYGEPKNWQVKENNTGDRNEDSGRSLIAHPDRIITWAEGADDGSIYGVSSLKAVFNALINAEKVVGAGGEGMWKNARGSQFISIDKDANLSGFQSMLGATSPEQMMDRFNEMIEDHNKGFDNSLITQGMTRETISADLPDPEPFLRTSLAEIAAGTKYPLTIMIGMQTGRLASDEDQKQMAKMIKSRREWFVNLSIRKTISRFIKLGFIDYPEGGYEIEWPDLFAPGLSEKIENFSKIADANEKLRRGGAAPLTTEQMMMISGLDDDGKIKIETEAESEDLGDNEDDKGSNL